MQKTLVSIIILFTLNCNYLQESSGTLNNIIVLVSKEDKPFVKQTIENNINDTIYTPAPELEFNFKYKFAWELNDIKNSPNIIISSLKYPKDSTGDYLMSKIKKKHDHNENLFLINNMYAKNQVILGLDMHDAIELQKEISMNKFWIKSQFTLNVESGIKKQLYKYGHNKDLSNIVNIIFGYNIHLQPDFQIIKLDSLNSFLWIGRGYPFRWITFHKSLKSNYKSTEYSWSQLEKDFKNFMPQITISEYFRKINKSNNQIIMRGLFEHDESQSGGPFFTYIFDTNINNELILVSGFVSYPGHDKYLLLKQLEVIIKTFNKGE